MNILYRTNESRNGFVPSIIEELREKEVLDHCIVISQGTDIYNEDYCTEIKAWIGYYALYEAYCDVSQLPAISGDLFTSLLPYKDTIINMMCRRFNAHIMFYDEMEREYAAHVLFWNWILDKHSIDFCFFSTTPHVPWEYTIYALACVKKIPILIETGCNIYELARVGTKIENLGLNSSKLYLSDYYISDMTDEVRRFYNNTKNNTLVTPVEERKKYRRDYINWIEVNFRSGNKVYLKDYLKLIYRIMKGTPKEIYKDIYIKKDNKRRLRLRKKQYRGLKYFDSIAIENLDYNRRYIIYMLHYDPESSTLPMGGVFSNQLLAIRLLAQAAKKRGIAVYVKEHWFTTERDLSFYDDLDAIPNVYLVKSTEDTIKLIDSSIATSSITGTCMLEALIRGIPVLSFSLKDFEGVNGCFCVNSIDTILHAIDSIQNDGFCVNIFEVERFLKIFGQTHPCYYLDWPKDANKVFTDKARKATIDLISQFIDSGMSETFCYQIDRNLDAES